jgi:hypothetical protein
LFTEYRLLLNGRVLLLSCCPADRNMLLIAVLQMMVGK